MSGRESQSRQPVPERPTAGERFFCHCKGQYVIYCNSPSLMKPLHVTVGEVWGTAKNGSSRVTECLTLHKPQTEQVRCVFKSSGAVGSLSLRNLYPILSSPPAPRHQLLATSSSPPDIEHVGTEHCRVPVCACVHFASDCPILVVMCRGVCYTGVR